MSTLKSRKKKSGGQAIVMVTLALFAMCGMMGLAVDLGFSYFIQKEAQAAADGAATAAVHKAYVILGGSVGGLSSCPASIDCVGGKNCLTSGGIATTSNLYNGCLYAKANSFNWDTANSKQSVYMTAGLNSTPPNVAGTLQGIVYWVTVQTAQVVPQLFTSMLPGHPATGLVAASATAGIVAQTFPGSFLGMNREGDCQTDIAGSAVNCGVDLDVAGAGNGTCLDINGVSTGVNASVCGPAGVYLASQCNGSNNPIATGCQDSSGKNAAINYAGQTHGNSTIWASTNQIRGTGNVNDCSAGGPVICSPTPSWKATPNTPPTVTNGHSGSIFTDPDSGLPQPPVAGLPSGTALTPCPVSDAGGPTASLSGVNLGPFAYYSVTKLVGGVADGHPMVLSPGVKFSTSGTCPSNVAAVSNSSNTSFGTYIFYGGVDASSVNTTTGNTFGPGEYIFAGTTTLTGNPSKGDSGYVLTATGAGNITGDGSTGTLFVFTDANYPGLTNPPDVATFIANGNTFYQGFVYLKNTPGSLTGLSDSLPGTASALNQYGGNVFWADVRNTSKVASGYYDSTDTWFDCPSTPCSPPASYHATNTSPQMILDHGNGSLTLSGVLHQPRGAWIQINAGGAAVANSPLQVLTGAMTFTTGGGGANVVLLGVARPTVIYKTALIQ